MAGDPDKHRELQPPSTKAVHLELALLDHLFTFAIKERGIGLPFNPASNVRRPTSAGAATGD